jgi:branched-chain amino acid transport system substrate-binding protein
MTTRRRILAAGAAFAAVALTAMPGAARADIKVGAFGPMTGDAAGYGQSLREGVELAINEQNEKGGVLGQKLVPIFGDDAGKPEQAVSIAKRLATSDEVVIMLGSVSSPASFAASQVAQQTETPQIVISGTAQKITTQGNQWIFRSAVPDTKLAGDLVDFIHERFPKLGKFGFIYVNDDFGKGGVDAFKLRAKNYEMEVVAEEKYTRGDLDFTGQLTRIKSSGAQALVDWSRYAEASLIAKQMKQMGMEMPRFGSDGQAHPKFLELAGTNADGMYYPTHFSVATASDIPAAKIFIEKVRKIYGKDPDYVHAQAYDAATAAILAIEKAGKPDRTAIRDALRKTDYQSVRGPFKFDQKGDPTLVSHVVRIVNGKETNARLMSP